MSKPSVTKSPFRAREGKIGHFAKSEDFSGWSTTTPVTTAHAAPLPDREVGGFSPLARVGQIAVDTLLTMTAVPPSERVVGRGNLVNSPNLVNGGVS